jgi:2-polyprenyl-3-methyl-5-hydroxy-6-metoxy-1,4-benzoquinol methylase
LKLNETTNQQYWDERWSGWHKMSQVARWDQMWGPNGSFLRLIKRYTGNLKNLKILELGGAGSYHCLSLAKWGNAEITLIDYSAIGLEKTEAIYAKNGCPIKTIQADFFTWNPGEEKFDLIVHWGVLEHFQDPYSILQLCSECVKPGGQVIFTMPNMEAWGSKLWKKWSPLDWERHIFHSDPQIIEAARRAGLKFQEVFYWGTPLIQITAWEKTGGIQSGIRIIQRAFSLLGKLIPIYHHGTRKISMHRGFVFSKIL